MAFLGMFTKYQFITWEHKKCYWTSWYYRGYKKKYYWTNSDCQAQARPASTMEERSLTEMHLSERIRNYWTHQILVTRKITKEFTRGSKLARRKNIEHKHSECPYNVHQSESKFLSSRKHSIMHGLSYYTLVGAIHMKLCTWSVVHMRRRSSKRCHVHRGCS